MARIVALDYGTKRIGVAISDEDQKLAFPREYVLTSKKEKLLKLIIDEAVERTLIGLPKSLSGRETKSTKAARRFAEWLGQNSRAEIELIDERYTTKEAAGELQRFGQKQKAARELLDSLVAQKMLERYLRSR